MKNIYFIDNELLDKKNKKICLKILFVAIYGLFSFLIHFNYMHLYLYIYICIIQRLVISCVTMYSMVMYISIMFTF
jgi:hypothetical protein